LEAIILEWETKKRNLIGKWRIKKIEIILGHQKLQLKA